jgi:octaprenyl-diphosphate synthase
MTAAIALHANGNGAAGVPDPARLFEPIAADLRRVAEIFDRELHSDVPYVAELSRHIGGFRGKMLRPALVLLTARACGTVTRHHHTLAAVVEMVHVATLVHDDVLDESRLRRNRATVNQRWGNEAAVLLGDFLISHSYHLCSSIPDTEAARLVGAATNAVCEGEMLQVSRRGDFALTEAEYFRIIRGKTGMLTGLAARLGARYAGAGPEVCEAMHRYGTDLGMAFQIVDDVLDLTGDPAEVGKTLGTDLSKGKLTLPLIHLLSHGDSAARAAALAALRDDPVGRAAEIRRRLDDAGSLDHALSVAEGFVQSARTCLDLLVESDARDLLSATAEFVLHRRR